MRKNYSLLKGMINKMGKLVYLGVLIFMLLCFFTGCSNRKYNAKIYSKSNDWIKQDFLKNNKVRGAYYFNPDYIAGNDYVEEGYYDDSSPKSRTFIITEEESFNQIFLENKLDVNFDKEIVILYIFCDIYPYRNYYIKTISLKKEVLNITLRLEKYNKADATMPCQRCLVIKMNKKNLNSINIYKG